MYPFTNKDIQPLGKEELKDFKISSFFQTDLYYFPGISEFICKPNFKKACLIGRLQAQIGIFGVKIKTQKLETGSLRVFLILKKLTAAKIQKFFLGFDSLSGKKEKSILFHQFFRK